MGVRQTIFGPPCGNFSRMPSSRQTLSRFGPIHCGQSSACATAGITTSAKAKNESKRTRMGNLLLEVSERPSSPATPERARGNRLPAADCRCVYCDEQLTLGEHRVEASRGRPDQTASRHPRRHQRGREDNGLAAHSSGGAANPAFHERGHNRPRPECLRPRVGGDEGRANHARTHTAARRSFAFETTLAARTYARWLDDMKRDGYDIHLFYYWLDSADVAIGRVAERVRAGGHHIPEDTIRRRYARSVRNFLELYRPVVTTWQVYDNTRGERRLIAFNNSFFDTILDQDTWDEFQRSANDGGANDPSGG